MAYQRQKKQQAEKPQAITVTELKVTRAHRWDNGGESFDMVLNGVNIYGCRLVDGKNGVFVSYPARKGTDGKYYSHVYAVLDDKTVEEICKQVDELLDK